MAGILMVESEPLIRQVCRRIFDRDGHDVDFAATIEEAQSLVKSGSKYSLLVTDLRFPDGNGLDFARVFREYHPAGNIIVMTGLSTFQGQEKAVDLGVADYIGKPFDVHEFGIRIRELTADRSRESRPAPGRVMIAAPDGEEYIRLFIKCLDRSGFESRLIGRVEELEGDCGPALPCIFLADTALGEAQVFDYCGRLRRSRAGEQSPPIIVLTEHPEPLLVKAREAGVNLLLSKPHKPYDLLHAVQDLVVRRKSGGIAAP